MEVESKVWVKMRKCSHVWLRGSIATVDKYDTNSAKFSIMIEDDYDSLKTNRVEVISNVQGDASEEYEDVKLRNEQDDEESIVDIDDLTDLHNLHEPSILNCLHARYKQEKIYSATGPILISINPFKNLSIYNSSHVEMYRTAGQTSHLKSNFSPIAPHIYRTADAAYRKMVSGFHSGDANQSILVSGESGSGKTESTKYIMRYLADITTPKKQGCGGDDWDDFGIEKQVLLSNPILESFGNACTVRNDNSSRFGKFVEINFVWHRSGHRIRGAITRTYLLEKVRLVRQSTGERNYHCFYELMAGAPEEEKWRLGLTSAADFHYTNHSGTFVRSHDKVDDAAQYRLLQESMDALCFTNEEREKVRNVLGAILHLGNIEFGTRHGVGDEEDGSELAEDCTSGSPCSPASHLSYCATLLGVSAEDMLSVLCEKSIRTAEGSLLKRQTKEEAEFARDALAKTLYGVLFDFLVQRVNATVGAMLYVEAGGAEATPVYMSPSSKENWRNQKKRAFIGVLDIFGFESLGVNSFEQLCINYTNETLQAHFNTFVFQHEQSLYQREGIVWKFIAYPDNGEALDLLENKRTGIFAMCDDQAKFPKATDCTLVNKFYEHCGSHGRFKAGPVEKGGSQFIVVHYAGDVLYSSQGFLEKNNDVVRNDMGEMLRRSSCWLVQRLCCYIREDEAFSSAAPSAESTGGNTFSSVNPEALPYTAPTRSIPSGPFTPVRRPSASTHLNGRAGGVTRRPSRVGSRRIRTLGAEFQMQLAELMENINRTSPHYVRCVKPNENSQPGEFKSALVVQQLKCGGVLESVRVTRTGYAVRITFDDFVKRYTRLLVPSSSIFSKGCSGMTIMQQAKDLSAELAELINRDPNFRPCQDALSQADAMARVGIQVGRSRVFLRRNAFDFLETQSLLSTRGSVVRMQSAVRRHIAMRKWRRLRRAVLDVQCAFRCCAASRELLSRQRIKASLTLQRVFRGNRSRLVVWKLAHSLLLIQCTMRRRLAIRRARRLRGERMAAVRLQASTRRHQVRRAYRRWVIEVREQRTALEERNESLELPAKEASAVSSPTTTPNSDNILPIAIIEDFRVRATLDRVMVLESELAQLKEQMDQVLARAALCLDVHVERARTLLVVDSPEQFELFRLGVSSPQKAARPPLASPARSSSLSPSHLLPLVESSEQDDTALDEHHLKGTHAFPALPSYLPSGDPGRKHYVEAMHALLLSSVQRGDVEEARYVLSSCPRVLSLTNSGSDGDGKNIMHVVCEQQLYEFVDLFLQYNPDLNAQTAEGKSYLHLVSDSKVVEMLCAEGADPNLLDKSGQTPLHLYVSHKLYGCVRTIVGWGADPYIEDWRSRKSALQSAAAMGDYRLLRTLLSDTTVSPKIDRPDFDGNTLLHLVCMTEVPGSQVHKCIMLLLDRGAAARAVNIRGITPLHFIAANQYVWHSSDSSKEEVLQLVQLLLTLSVDVNAKDLDGCTALVVACAHRKFELCQILFQHNADMNIPCAMNSYLLRRGNHSEEEHQVDGLDCTASDLFPPGRRRSDIFANINSKQSQIDLESRNRCMNCADSLSSGFFSRAKINCGMCGRVVCEDCISKQHIVKADRAPPFLSPQDGESVISVCVVCGPILAENYPSALRESRGRSGSKGFLSW